MRSARRSEHRSLATLHERPVEFAESIMDCVPMNHQDSLHPMFVLRHGAQPDSFPILSGSRSTGSLRDHKGYSATADGAQLKRTKFSNKVAARKSLRPFAHYSCGHSQQTATVGVPNGDSHARMLETVDDGTMIFVGPRLQTALDEANKGALRIPMPCPDCELRSSASLSGVPESSSVDVQAHGSSPAGSSGSARTVTGEHTIEWEPELPSQHASIKELHGSVSQPSTESSASPSTS